MGNVTYIWDIIMDSVGSIPITYYMNILMFISCVCVGSILVQFIINHQAIDLFRYMLNSFIVICLYFVISTYLPTYATSIELSLLLKLLSMYGLWTLMSQIRKQKRVITRL